MLMQTELRTVSVSRKNAIPRPARGGFGAMEAMGSQMRFGPNEEIFGDGEPAEYVYKVIKGAVRT
jgi:CRP/FNR family transcriptional regulator, nitrogen fixation regulation protein